MKKTRRGTASIVASPVLVGAVTVLIVLVAVFLAYNANNGLPFVPTYDVWAQLPGGANLVKGNEVRVGGFRVGVVDKIQPQYDPALHKTIARIHMKLDKSVQPLSKDTTLIVRQRSALGLKYIQITPGPRAGELPRGRHDPAQVRRPAGGVRRPLQHVRPEDAHRLAAGAPGLRRRAGRPRRLAERRRSRRSTRSSSTSRP